MSEITVATSPAFEIGSSVVLLNDGETYSTYDAMAEFIGLTGYTWGKRGLLVEGNVYTVVGSAIHQRAHEGEVVGIERDGEQFLVGAKGLSLVSKPKVLLSEQVAAIEAELVTVTAERDALQAKLDAILNVVKGE